jgi:hypothetical protein
MIVVRFKVKCKPQRTAELRAAFEEVVLPSRMVPGVLNFDIAQDIIDPDSFIATLAEVQKVISLLPSVLAGEPEATVYDVASSEPWG